MDSIFTINGKPYVRFEVITLDVWGNKREGFDVNNLYSTGEYVTLPAEFTNRDVVKALKGADYIKRNVRHTSIDVAYGDHESDVYVWDARTGEPLIFLQQR